MTRKSNNFDACRLVGAFFVLVNHSMELSGHTSLGFGGMSISTLGVKIFFAISGYLIATRPDSYGAGRGAFCQRLPSSYC
jgi:peptidoglycan/LPS O-acetylase OafA/YrhL